MIRDYDVLYYELNSGKIGNINILATSISHAKSSFNNFYGSYRKIKNINWIR